MWWGGPLLAWTRLNCNVLVMVVFDLNINAPSINHNILHLAPRDHMLLFVLVELF